MDITITPEVLATHNLTQEEYARIKELMGREPTFVELGVFSVMWSEHCSYKSSRVHLKRLPTRNERVVVPPGENAGVVDVGDGWCAAFKVESHNHPSFIEPFQGAATGVGGILRDIFTMGARPVAAMNSLRFGTLDHDAHGRRNRGLLAGVVAGIAHYGNAFGVATVGGEVMFDDAYALNPLVNAFALGLVRHDQIFFGRAEGVDNPVLYVGAKTGRDGIHGATMASAEFDEEALEKRPTVQVGDPFLEKLLLEACLEAMRSGAVAGIQDMGAAGLTSSSCEMAARAGTGVELDLTLVPQREQAMTAYEIMLSESQERMLVVAHRGRERQVIDIFKNWDLDAVVIGRVTDTRRVQVIHHEGTVADIPVAFLTDEAPVYNRPMRAPERPGDTAGNSGSTAETFGGAAQISGSPAENFDAGAQISGSPAKSFGSPAEISGSSAETSGSSAEISGSPAGKTGERAQISGSAAGETGEAAGNSGEGAENSGDPAGSTSQVRSNVASVVNSDELDEVLEAPSSVVSDDAPGDAHVTAEGGQSTGGGRRAADEGRDFNESLLKILASPNVASKEWVYRQYDHMVRTNTAVLPGADAAIVRIKETRRALAMCLDGHGRYCAASPREGARLVVAEAARNVVCVGARPIAITNCLNFPSPERPEVMWAFSETIDGMAEACRAFDTPVISGNVSFYNETEGRGILPTPVIGMVGLVEEVSRIVQPGFKAEGDLVALLGETGDDLSISEYAATVEGRATAEMIAAGRVPALSLERERAVQETCLKAIEEGLLRSAHDCSDGGLAVAVAESCFSTLGRAAVGAEIELPADFGAAAQLFSESPSRIVVSFNQSARARVEELAAQLGCPFRLLGRAGGARLRVSVGGREAVSRDVAELERAWRTSLSDRLKAEALAAAAE